MKLWIPEVKFTLVYHDENTNIICILCVIHGTMGSRRLISLCLVLVFTKYVLIRLLV